MEGYGGNGPTQSLEVNQTEGGSEGETKCGVQVHGVATVKEESGKVVACEETLSRNQRRARQQHRRRGRFVPDPSRPGMSASTSERAIRHERQRRTSTCRRNVWLIVSALLREGESRDFVPSSADGPLTTIIDTILKPQFRVPSRMVPAIARQVYLQKSQRNSVPRRNLRKHGAIVKKRVAVFAGMRLPCANFPLSLAALRTLLSQLHSSGMLRDQSVDACLERLVTVFNSYNADTYEYDDYPIVQHSDFEESTDTPATVEVTGGSDEVDERGERNGNE